MTHGATSRIGDLTIDPEHHRFARRRHGIRALARTCRCSCTSGSRGRGRGAEQQSQGVSHRHQRARIARRCRFAAALQNAIYTKLPSTMARGRTGLFMGATSTARIGGGESSDSSVRLGVLGGEAPVDDSSGISTMPRASKRRRVLARGSAKRLKFPVRGVDRGRATAARSGDESCRAPRWSASTKSASGSGAASQSADHHRCDCRADAAEVTASFGHRVVHRDEGARMARTCCAAPTARCTGPRRTGKHRVERTGATNPGGAAAPPTEEIRRFEPRSDRKARAGEDRRRATVGSAAAPSAGSAGSAVMRAPSRSWTRIRDQLRRGRRGRRRGRGGCARCWRRMPRLKGRAGQGRASRGV